MAGDSGTGSEIRVSLTESQCYWRLSDESSLQTQERSRCIRENRTGKRLQAQRKGWREKITSGIPDSGSPELG